MSDSEALIRIEHLYKIFGSRPQSKLSLVKQGIDKQELLEEHQHVLGLTDINLEIPKGSLQVVMDSLIWQIHADSSHQPPD